MNPYRQGQPQPQALTDDEERALASAADAAWSALVQVATATVYSESADQVRKEAACAKIGDQS